VRDQRGLYSSICYEPQCESIDKHGHFRGFRHNLALQPGVADHFVHHLGLRREPSDAAKAYASPMQTQAPEDCAAHCRNYAGTADAKKEMMSVDYVAVDCQG